MDTFAVEKGTIAFGTSSNSDGCALPGYSFDKSETLLTVVSSAKASVATSTPSVTSTSTSTPSTSSSSTSPTQTTTQPQPSEASSSPKSNTGAIAGGVVGGVAGVALIAVLVWWLFTRRTKRQPALHGPQVVPVTDYKTWGGELDGRSTAHELEGQGRQANPHELPANSTLR